jgi:DNA-binding transcriptional MocR family regulator
MTPTEEARFIQLWNAGMEQTAMAQALGIPRGTVSSRAYTLVRQGKITARPKGGQYPRQRQQGRRAGTPAPPAPQVPPRDPHGTRATGGPRTPRDDLCRRPRDSRNP